MALCIVHLFEALLRVGRVGGAVDGVQEVHLLVIVALILGTATIYFAWKQASSCLLLFPTILAPLRQQAVPAVSQGPGSLGAILLPLTTPLMRGGRLRSGGSARATRSRRGRRRRQPPPGCVAPCP